MAGSYERQEDAGKGDVGFVKYWRGEIELSSKREEIWRQRAEKVIKRYRDDERPEGTGKKFNLFWSNIETLKPAVYSQTPAPVVKRRFLDEDPVAREASTIIERALTFSIDDFDFDGVMESVRDDMLLVGRGIPRIRLESDIQEREPAVVSKPEGEQFILDGEVVVPDDFRDDGTPLVRDVGDQSVFIDYVYWDDFRIFPAGAQRWPDVYGVGFRHLLTREQLEEQFPSVGKEIPLSHTKKEGLDGGRQGGEPFKRAVVWEIWDNRSKERIWIADGFDNTVEREDDPLKLSKFFPVPQPLYGVKTTDSMIPIPEMTIYQDQLIELDELTDRINTVMSAVKVRGVYAAAVKEMRDLLEGDDNQLIPVEDWEALRDKGGIESAIAWLPIESIAKALVILYRQREAVKQEIFEITGLSDILRGSTVASESATAQRLKGNFGQIRMTPRQKPVQELVRDVFRMMAEVIAEHFTKPNLERMTGKPVPDEVFELLRSDSLRSFRIDVETDSTLRPDMDQEKAQAVEFAAAITQFMTASAPIVAQAPEMVPVMSEILKSTVRRFRAGRQVEDAIEQALQQIAQRVQQSQGQQKESPAETAVKGQLALKKEKVEGELAIDREKMQGEQKLDQERLASETRLKAMESQIKTILDALGNPR